MLYAQAYVLEHALGQLSGICWNVFWICWGMYKERVGIYEYDRNVLGQVIGMWWNMCRECSGAYMKWIRTYVGNMLGYIYGM